jgi:RNA polymerase sigma-70 factor (ECF subfamily)
VEGEGRIGTLDAPAAEERNRRLAELYREHSEALRHFLLGFTRDSAEADEVQQQVFLKLLESWQSVEPATAKGWLFTAGYHEGLARRRRRLVDAAALERLWARPVWQQGSEPADPSRAAIKSHETEAVRRAIDELPAEQREVVRRRMYLDQTFATIASELGCPLNTVLSRMRLAMEKLRRKFEEIS